MTTTPTRGSRARALRANIWKYYVLRIFVKRLVWPILTIFLVRNRLSPAEIGIVFSVGTIIGLLLEVPSGAIADRIGRRTSMALNFFGSAVSMALFAWGTTFPIFLLAQAVYQAAGSLWTGTNEAFLYETLHELGRASELKKITGRALFVSQISTGALFVVVPLLAKISLPLPFILNVIVFAVAGFLALALVEPQRAKSVEQLEVGKDFFGFRAFFSHRLLLAAGLFFASLDGVGGILEDFRQLWLDIAHVDLAYFGFVYLALRLLTGFVGAHIERIERILGKRGTLFAIPALMLLTYIPLTLVHAWWGVAFLVLDGVGAGISRPLEQEHLNRHVDGTQRATMLSIFNLIGSLLRAGVVLVGGFLIHRAGISAGFALSAALTVFIVIPLLIWFLRTERTHGHLATSV